MRDPPKKEAKAGAADDGDDKDGKERKGKRQRVDATSPAQVVKAKPLGQQDLQVESDGSASDDDELDSKVEKLVKKFINTSISVSSSFSERELDSKKLGILRSLFPEVIALEVVMPKSERQVLLKNISSFDSIIPAALKKDLSNLSSKLSRVEKRQIETLFLAQVRTREKLRVVLARLYESLVTSVSLDKQSEVFKSWHMMLILLVDDFVWLVKEQQLIILEKHGLKDVVSHDARSIIPTELKDRVKEIKDFRHSLDLDHFSRGGGYRGRRYPSRGYNSYRSSGGFRGRNGGPSNFSRRGGFNRPNGGFNRSSSPFRVERDGYRSGGSSSSGRGRARGRGHIHP